MPSVTSRSAGTPDEIASQGTNGRPLLPSLSSVELGIRCRLIAAEVNGPFDSTSWFWEWRLPLFEFGLFVGPGDVAKTYVVLDLAAQLSRGELPGALYGRKGKTIYFSDEASFERVITPRYAAAGGEPESLFGAEFIETTSAGDELIRPMSLGHTDVRVLAEKVADEQIDLLIFDPIDMLLGSIDSHRNNEVRAALRLIMTTGCTVIGIQHVTKGSSAARAGDRVMGSVAYRNFPRSVLMVDRYASDRDVIVLAHDKSNYRPRQPSLSFKIVDSDIEGYGRVEWLGQVEASADDLLARRSRGPSLKERCCTWLSEFLEAQGPTAPREAVRLASEAGFGRSTTYEARRQLPIVTRDGRWTLE